jgi:CheY-like chemotaxis protein
MPLMDGYSATSKLRQLGYRCAIVALTANALRQERTRAHRTGMDGFLTKVFTILPFAAFFNIRFVPSRYLTIPCLL